VTNSRFIVTWPVDVIELPDDSELTAAFWDKFLHPRDLIGRFRRRLAGEGGGGADFRVLPPRRRGRSGDGYAAPGLWGRYGAAGLMIRNVSPDGTERFLLVQRGPEVSSNRGKWQLPGGALDEHETPEQGAAREIVEEVGASPGYLARLQHVGTHAVEADIPDSDRKWRYSNIAVDAPEMFAPEVDGTETGDARWVTRNQLLAMAELHQLHRALARNLSRILRKYPEVNPVTGERIRDPSGRRAPLTAAMSSAGKWRPEQHPRGADGKFIAAGPIKVFLSKKSPTIDDFIDAALALDADKWKKLTSDQKQRFIQVSAPLKTATLKPFADKIKTLADAHPPTAPTSAPTAMPKSTQLVKIGGQKGSNLGGIFEDPATGDKFYVKKAKSQQHAANEVAAAALYALAGVETPTVEKTSGAPDIGGGLQTRTRLVPGVTSDLPIKLQDPEYRKKIHEGFVVDAWLANWDVAGLTYDNVVTDENGNPVRIDVGGALLYRAMGGPKGPAFGDVVGELETLRDSKMNPQSAKVFADMTDEELRESAKRVQAVTPAQIDQVVASSGLPPSVAETLKKRRQYIIDKYLSGESTQAPPATATPGKTGVPALDAIDSYELWDAVTKMTPDEWMALTPQQQSDLVLAVVDSESESDWEWGAAMHAIAQLQSWAYHKTKAEPVSPFKTPLPKKATEQKKYPKSAELLDYVEQLDQAAWDALSDHEKSQLTNNVEDIGIHNSDLADQAETALEKIADLDEGIYQSAPPSKPIWVTQAGVVAGKSEIFAYGDQLTTDQWSSLTQDERDQLVMRLDTIMFFHDTQSEKDHAAEILNKISDFISAEDDAAEFAQVTHTPTLTMSGVIGHEGKKPGSPAKVTTKLIWGKHPDGTIILEVSSPGVSHQRVIWDETTKKFIHQIETTTDPKYGEQWDDLKSYTKKDAYATLQNGVWFVPNVATVAPETSPTHAPYVDGTVPPLGQVAKMYAKDGYDVVVVKLHSGQYVMTYGGDDGASLTWTDDDPATLGWHEVPIDPAKLLPVDTSLSPPIPIVPAASPPSATDFEPHEELDFAELFENMDVHSLAPGMVIGVSSKGFWRMIVNDTGAIELQFHEHWGTWKLETYLNPETDNDLIDQLKTYTFESWLDPQSEAGKKALKAVVTQSAAPALAAPAPAPNVDVPIDVSEVLYGPHKADDVLAVSSDGKFKLVWGGNVFNPLVIYQDNGSYWQEVAQLSPALIKEGEEDLHVTLAGVSGNPDLTWVKPGSPTVAPLPAESVPAFWTGVGGVPIANWGFEDIVTDWDFAFAPASSWVVARSTSGNYRVLHSDDSGALIKVQKWNPATDTWNTVFHLNKATAAAKLGSMPETWIVPHSGLTLATPGTTNAGLPLAPPGPQTLLTPPPPVSGAWPKPPPYHVKIFKEILKTQPGGAVGYWSKPEKLWQAVVEMQSVHKNPDGTPVYTYAAIVEALDAATKTKDVDPYSTKIKKWLKTPAGAKFAKTFGEAVLFAPAVPPVTKPVPAPPPPPVMKVPTAKELFQKVWKQSAPGSPDEVLLTGTDQVGNQTRIIATVSTSGAPVALLQRFNPKTKKWARVKQYKTEHELDVLLTKTSGFTWDAKPVESSSNISAVTDTSHVDQVTKQKLYDLFKKQPATYLSSPPQDIYAAASTIASDHGLSLGQMISIIDEMGALKVKKPDEQLFFKKMSEWLATPKGYAVAHGIQLPKPPTPPLVAGAGGKIPTLAESNKYTYSTISTTQAGTLWSESTTAHGSSWTSSQQAALKSYTGGVYYTLNAYLYGKLDTISTSQQNTTQQIQLGMRPSTKPMLLHRGVGLGGIGGAKSYQELLKLVGSTWKSEGFASTSVGGHAAFSGNPIIIEIEAPPGTPMAWVKPISHHSSENEMVLAAGLHFHILQVTQQGGKSIVRVRVVPEP